jgi:stage V sporulation protein B
VLVGSANGARDFHKQAGLDVTFATLRAIGILGAAALGFGVYGAIGAWVAAVGAIIAVAFTWIGGPAGARPAPLRPLFLYLGGLAAYLILNNLLLYVDSFWLKRTVARYYLDHGMNAVDAARAADGQLGLYSAALKLARLPYQLMLAVTFVIFPLVSRATFENDREKVKGYIRGTLRMSLVVAGALGVGLGAHATALMGVPFKPEFMQAGPALSALAMGHVALAVFSIGGTVLNSAGLTRQAVLTALATLAFMLVSLFLVVPRFEPGRAMLTATALCTGGSMVLGASFTGIQLVRHFGAFLPLLSAVRVIAAAAAAFAVCHFVPVSGKVMALAGAVLGGIVYLVALVITGELGKADLDRVLAIARRRKS